ncbi:MAG: glycoside hydrolase family 127 protein, partial [Bacteroidota bacterium]
PERSGWFECSCCPTNITRLLPSVPGYMYAQKDDKVYVNLFANSTTSLMISGKPVEIVQQNNYPWDGDLKFTVSPKKSSLNFGLLVRIPGWAQNEAIPSDLYTFENSSASKATIKVNGVAVDYTIEKGYAVINRAWKKNDVVEVSLPMEVRRVVANKNAKDDAGKIALQRGPLMYCAEWPDNNGRAANIVLPANTVFATEYEAGLLNGVTVLKADATAIVTTEDKVSSVKQSFVAIPYYAWANRGKGEMMVWFPEKIKDVDIIAK